LETASVQLDVRPFAAFIFERVTWSPDKGKPNSG
jgi:hypothetical protein